MANEQNLKPWPKGVSGNPKGKPPTKAVDEIFREFLAEIDKTPKGAMQERLRTLIEGQYYAAVKGSTPAAEFIMNRAHGKVKDKTEHSGNVETTITVASEGKKKLLEEL
jgi:hypothetical protein